ncbi:MAG: hypothetical protein ACYSR9_14415, partial [Planctomycetota bacterium]
MQLKKLFLIVILLAAPSFCFAQAGNYWDGNKEHIEGWEGSKGAFSGKGNAGGGFDLSNFQKVTFGSFEDDGSTWTFGQAGGGGWALDGTDDEADCDGVQTSAVDLEQAVGQVATKNWYVAFTVKNYSAGTVKAIFGGTSGTSRNADGAYIERLQAVDTSNLKIQADSSFIGSVDNVAVFSNLFTAFIKDSSDEGITPREGNNYLHIQGTWPGESSEAGLGMKRAYMYLEGQDMNGANELAEGDGTEYWNAFSLYIEPGYDYRPYGAGLWSFRSRNGAGGECNPDIPSLNIGGAWDSDCTIDAYLRIHTSTYQIFTSEILNWCDLEGTWVDIAIRYRIYDEDNSNARAWIYVNGTKVWGGSADGKQNVPTGCVPNAGNLRNYNWWADYCDDGGTVDCGKAGCWPDPPHGNTDCDTAGWTSDVRVDAYRAKYHTDITGNGDSEAPGHYCEVAPEIRAATPTITTPSQGATDVALDFTAE